MVGRSTITSRNTNALSIVVGPAAVLLGSLVGVWIFQSFATRKNEKSSSRIKQVPRVNGGPVKVLESIVEMLSKNGHEWMLQQSRSLGKVFCFQFLPFTSPVYVICDYKAARKCLEDVKSQKANEPAVLIRWMAGGRNFSISKGHRWRHVRKSTATFFAQPSRFDDQIETCLQKLIETTIKPATKEGQPIDVMKAMAKFAATVFVNVLCGYEWESETELIECVADVDAIFAAISECMHVGKTLFPALYKDMRAARKSGQASVAFGRKLLESYRHRRQQGGSQPEDSLIAIIDKDTEYASDEERVHDIWAYQTGGFDTTARSISWVLHELASHVDVQDKLRHELAQCTTKSEKYRCPYLKCVVRESMRLNATAPIVGFRYSGSDIVVQQTKDGDAASEMIIPRNSRCMIGSYAILRDGSVFENPDEFDPSRWETPSQEALLSYMPFSLGVQNCVAQALALEEMLVAVACLVEQYSLELVRRGHAIYSVTLACEGALLRFTPV